MQKKVEDMFHALRKVNMRACYAKQNIILAGPNRTFFYNAKRCPDLLEYVVPAYICCL